MENCNNNYDIDSLIVTFKQHAEKSKKDMRECVEKFKENYPEEPLPAHFLDDFNICDALVSMCEEINMLKDRNNGL